MKYFLLCFLFFSQYLIADSAPWVGNDLSGLACKDVDSAQFGPFDYTNSADRAQHLKIVEEYHFGREVEALQNYKHRDPILNLNYTLSAWPNHHRALIAVTRYQILFNLGIKKSPLMIPAECYFQRAINFSKHDGVIYLLYAKYLAKLKKFDMAERFYQKALELLPKNPAVHYNYGIFLFDSKRFKEARQHADLAREYGHPGTQLFKKLDKVNN